MTRWWLAPLSALVQVLPLAAATLPSIAVIDFEARGVAAHEAAIIADRFRGQLVSSGAFTVMERGQMEAILKEQGFQATGACSEASCVIEMGQLLSVTSIVTGSVGKIGAMYTVDMKVIDIKTGQIRLTLNRDVKGAVEDVLLVAVPEMCDKLVKEVLASAQTVGYISVMSEPAGAAVILDGKEVGTTPLKAMEAQAGTHTVDVTLAGFAPQSRSVNVLKGKSEELSLTLSPTSEHLAQQKEQSSAKRKTVGKALRWVGAGLAVAGAGAATAFWLNANSTYDEYTASQNTDALAGLWDDTQSSATFGNISAIVGAVGAVVLGVSFAF